MARLPKSYIKKYGISKRAWREFRKSKSGRKKSSSRKRSNPKKGVRRVARRSKKLSLFYSAGALYAFAKPVNTILANPTDMNQWKLAGKQTVLRLTGWYPEVGNESFDFSFPIRTYGAMIIAGLAKRYLGKFVNRGLRNIPLIGEYVRA